MTDLESPKKNNDCYFYYYSTCAKGDSCTFRHEPSALGCETMCSFWKEGKCLNVHCNFRHMELRKNRKAIPCYWESQPMGCLKAHCPFLHQNPRPSEEVSVEKSNIPAEKSNNDTESSERKVTAVDSLVVNFEEESDNESMPTFSPLKGANRIVRVKTLEEIRLEKVQAESAAYYSYPGENSDYLPSNTDGDDLRQRIVRRIISKQLPQQRTVTLTTYPSGKVKSMKRLSDDELANILGDDSLRKKQKTMPHKDNGNFQIILDKTIPEGNTLIFSHEDSESSQLKKNISYQKYEPAVVDIKIKTLAEIRAERDARRQFDSEDSQQKGSLKFEDQEEAEVSSTSVDESVPKMLFEDSVKSEINAGPRRKIKLRRKLNLNEKNIASSNDRDENVVTSNEDNVQADQNYRDLSDKMDEDVLLLDDDEEDYEDVTLKAEDELLNEINSFIDN